MTSQAHYQQQTFEVANASGASIVKPTLPRNVLDEFQEFVSTGNRRKSDQELAQNPQLQGLQASVPQTAAAAVPQPKPEIPIRPQAAAAPAQVDQQRIQLIGAMQAFLRKKKQAVTLGELSSQVKSFTGHGWGGHWEHEYGNLALFLKANPEAFTVVKNKYVVCAGQEELATRQMELDLQAATQAASLAYNSQPPPAAQQYFVPPPQQQYMDPFGFQQPPPQYYQPQQQQTSFYQEPQTSFYQESPANNNNWWDGGVPPPTQQYFTPYQPQYSDNNHWQVQQQQEQEAALRRRQQEEQEAAVRRRQQEEQEAALRKQLREEQEQERLQLQREKEQWERDEEMARRMQEEEFAKGRQQSSAVQRKDSSSSRETLVLSTTQMRDLAEREIGIDNVRIIAGFSVKKFGREGRPHQRKIWVTQSLTHVAWQSSLMEGNHRGIELKHVTQVASGQMTPTITKNTTDPARIQRDTLVNALRAVVEFNKKYRPVKLDRDRTQVLAIDQARYV
ncbi:hypothetical protein BASA81_015044 [Batrachochytrium salamandrivorans]|nr:hypothetical protein BASA81_015044 [Batrachochytrium salamandrivorans]